MKKLLYILCISALVVSAKEIRSDSCSSSCSESSSCSSSCSSSSDCHSCECQVTNKSFLSIRPFFEAASPAKVALIRTQTEELRYNNGSLFQVVPFGGRTVKGDRLGQYFGPSCKRVLNVNAVSPIAPSTGTTDIIAAQLNIITVDRDTFESTFCLTPEQTFAGAGLNYRTHFGCKDQNRGFFIDLTLPVYYVRNKMNLNETIINDGGGADVAAGGVGSVTAAFKQSSWCFGRIDDCEDISHVGVSEFDAQIGYGWGKDQSFMHSYIGVIIPTGNKVKGHKVFEPIIGWNHNVAVHFGSSFGIELWQSKCEKYSIWYELAIDSRYFFENKQHRSFDLKNKPWSRYMMTYANLAQAQLAETEQSLTIGTPGINIFTQEVKVRPRFQRTYNTAFALDLVNWTLEAGYNFFCRDEECVKLACPWAQLVGVKFENVNGILVPIDGPALKSLTGLGATDNVQLISNDFQALNAVPVGDYAQNIITEDQLDLSTAQAPCLLSQRLYGSVGYAFDACDNFRTLLGLGGEYEFAGDNSGINRWGVWGKVAFIF